MENEFSALGLLYCADQLELQGVLGEGAFGVVQKGLLCAANRTTEPVAVKSLKGNNIVHSESKSRSTCIKEYGLFH